MILTGASGNTDSFGLGIRLDSSYENKMRGYDFYLSYLNSTKRNVTIVDETTFGVDYESRFFEELAWYAKTDLENDRLEEVDLRATAALGLNIPGLKLKTTKLQYVEVLHLDLKNLDPILSKILVNPHWILDSSMHSN